MKTILIAAAMLFASLRAYGQYTTVTATDIHSDATGGLLAKGQICFQGTDQNDIPLNYQAGGGGQVVIHPACQNVANGAISGGLQVANPAYTSPGNIYYRVTVKDTASGQVVLTYKEVVVSGSTWNFDAYAPPTNPALLPPSGGTVNGPLSVLGNLSFTGTCTGCPTGGSGSGVSTFNGRAGAVGLTYSDVTGALGFTPSGGGVTSFNSRTGALSLLSSDVTTALGYTPPNPGAVSSITSLWNFQSGLSAYNGSQLKGYSDAGLTQTYDIDSSTGNASFQNITVSNNTVTGSQQANSMMLTGDPNTAPSSAVSYGGNTYACPSGAPAGASTCIKVNANGVTAYIPIWTGSSSTGNPSWWPSIPSTATTFANLQAASGNSGVWTICNANGQYNTVTNSFTSTSPCSAGTPSGTGTAAATYGVSTPSESGAALELSNTTSSGSSTGWDSLMYRHLGSSWAQGTGSGTNTNTSITNMVEDVWFYPAPGSNITAFEFDPDMGTSGSTSYTYKASLQCDHAASDVWRLYNTAGAAWVTESYPCNFATSGANAWHHIQLWMTVNETAHTYTYQGLAVDGTTIFSPSSPPPTATYNALSCSGTTCGSLGSNVNMESQIDNNSSAGTSTGYYDKYTLIVW